MTSKVCSLMLGHLDRNLGYARVLSIYACKRRETMEAREVANVMAGSVPTEGSSFELAAFPRPMAMKSPFPSQNSVR